jgi:hypothetical protein
MYFYNAYGLGIHSILPLPELVAVTEIALDVAVRLGKVGLSLPEAAGTGSYFHMSGEEAYFFWDQVGTFLARAGKEIIVDPSPGAEAQLVRLPLLGAVLAVLLSQRGVMVLHGNAIAVNGTAIAFLGGKGSGKSSIAAALYARGHHFVADDLVALADSRHSPLALPGFGQLKLWPEMAAAAMGDDAEALPRLHSQAEKRARQVNTRFVKGPVLLRQIYVLGRGSSPQIEPFRPQEAMIQLIANVYAARFGQQLLHTKRARHFLQCAELARSIPTYQLRWPLSPDTLAATVRLVEEHLALDTYDASV